jgi:DNA mismatch repair protein MutS
VIERAREVLKRHEQSEHTLSEELSPGAVELPSANGSGAATARKNGHQDMLFTPLDRKVLDQLREADLDHLAPIDALNLLAQLKKQIT